MLLDLLNRARRRIIAQLVWDKGALALTVGMAAVILLLLVGTQILDWYWPLLIALVSLSIGTYQLRAHIPNLYTLAQRIDRKLGLADTLSTAVYFREHPKPGAEAVCEAQRATAESAARGVSVEAALPYTRSRWLAPALGLTMVAVGLFAVRYAVVGSLDMSPSLLGMALDTFFLTSPEDEAKAGPRADLRPNPFDPTQPPSATENMTPEEASELMESEAEQENEGDGEGNLNDTEMPEAKGQEEDGSQDDKKGDKGDKGDDKSGEPKDSEQDSEQQGESEDRSLLDKLKDTVSNLLNQMKSNDTKQEQRAQQKGSQKGKTGEKGQKGQKGEKGEKSDPGDDKGERAEGSPDSDSAKQKSDQEGQPGKSPGKTAEEAQAGAGQDDGKKDIEQAKMLEAMGKLSELLGQRSEQVTGEMMMEVGTTKQQLRTQYSDQKAGHTASGSEIHRDEVPLMYQPYVERYFEEIRRAPQGKGTPPPTKGPAPKGK